MEVGGRGVGFGPSLWCSPNIQPCGHFLRVSLGYLQVDRRHILQHDLYTITVEVDSNYRRGILQEDNNSS